jgi:hypothetical protein
VGLQGRSGRVRKISPSTGIRFPDRTARRESLYQLSYPGPCSLFPDEEFCDLYRSLVIWVVQCRLRWVGHVGGMGRDTIDPDILWATILEGQFSRHQVES